jgi:hypothetical protein
MLLSEEYWALAVPIKQKTKGLQPLSAGWTSCQGLKPLSERAFFGTAEAIP